MVLQARILAVRRASRPWPPAPRIATHRKAARKYVASFVVSSLNDDDIKNLREYIIDYFLEKQNIYELFIPYEDGGAHSQVNGKTNIIATVDHETGIFYKIRVPSFIFNQLGINQYILCPDNPTFK